MRAEIVSDGRLTITNQSTKWLDRLFIFAFMMFMSSGWWNYVFSETVLSGWKQAVIVILFICCPMFIKWNLTVFYLFYFVLCLLPLLLLTSIIHGMLLSVVIFNIFFYVSWVPFFIWAARGGRHYLTEKAGVFMMGFLVFCAIGLVIDWSTDFFSFLMIRDELIDNFYLEFHDISKRAVFLFTATTLVMPVIGGIIVIVLLQEMSYWRNVVCGLVSLVVIFTTATTNSILIGGALAIGLALEQRSRFLLLAVIAGIVMFLVFPSLSGYYKEIDMQLAIATKDAEAEGGRANVGRFQAWDEAFNDIADFDVFEHVFGSGLGSTNGNLNTDIRHTHGESSFLQAYLEGGLVALTLRLLPFAVALTFFLHHESSNKKLILSYVAAIFVACAVAPIFGSFPSQVLLGFLGGAMYESKEN
jgi:hypothetical protein